MDRRTDEWIDGGVEGWMDMDGWVGQTDGRLNLWMDGWITTSWTDGMYKWMKD